MTVSTALSYATEFEIVDTINEADGLMPRKLAEID